MTPTLTEPEFQAFRRFIHEAAGISLSDGKKALVTGRLARRLQVRQQPSYRAYLDLIHAREEQAEAQIAVDLLTTNETYFFREPRHFEVLRDEALRSTRRPFRVWSAASSSGEEAYTMAMVLEDAMDGRPYEIVGTDISTRVLERARRGHYPMERARHVPPDCLRRHCLKGTGPHQGTLLVSRALRERARFLHVNLNEPLPDLGEFDVVFLRNVLIYFNSDTKRQVVQRVLSALRPGGLFCIGHSENLNDIGLGLPQLAPSVYRKP